MKTKKTMKKITHIGIAALVAMGMLGTSCNKVESQEMETPATPKDNIVTLTTTVGFAEADTKALAIDYTAKTLTKTFAVGEQVVLTYEDKDGNNQNTVSPALTAGDISADGKSAKLTFSLTNPKADGSIIYQYPASIIDENGNTKASYFKAQNGTLDDVATRDYAKYDGSFAGTNLPASATLDNEIAVVAFTLYKSDGTTDITNTITGMTIEVSGVTYTITPSGLDKIYVAMWPEDGSEITITATDGSKNYTKTLTSKTYAQGEFYQQGLKMSASVPEGAINGKFSVASGKQVYFSKGNLQYQASSKTWRFAEHQYDFVGDATNGNVSVGSDKSNNASISSSYTGWIDLFGWGTSGKSFASGYGSAYQPWSKSTTSSAAYGPTGTNNLTGDYANGDWGVNMDGGWRTLSKAEWVYLFKTRTVNGGTGSRHSYTLGKKVNNVLGVVLYPDDYTGAVYTGANWSTFESAGCVFLPAAGYRNGTSVNSVGSYGAYWSSTASGTEYAYHVYFYSDSMSPEGYNGRSSGYSVRLVRPVE